MKISEAVAEIRETQGKIAKRARLAQAMKDPTFVEFVKAMYNPLVRYHINKIPDAAATDASISMKEFFEFDLLGKLSRREVTGNKASEYLQQLLETVEDPEAVVMIIKRDMDSGVSVNSVNSVIKNLIKSYPVMLCQPYNKKLAESFEYPAISQIKEDGLRGNIIVRNGVVSTFSRNGKELGLDDVFAFVGAKYPSGQFVLDGEVRVLTKSGDGYEPRKIGNGIINSCAKGGGTPEEMARVVFVAWDVISLMAFDAASSSSMGAMDRFQNLEEIVGELDTPQIVMVENRIVNSWEEAIKHFAEAIDDGQEGTILKSRDGLWEPGRPKSQMKLKLGELDFGDGKYNRECDLEIIGFKEGNKKYKGKMGAVIYASSDRKLSVSVGGGWSDKDREEIWKNRDSYMGKIGTVRYNEKINSGDRWSLFLPRIVEAVRIDKDVADSFEEIK